MPARPKRIQVAVKLPFLELSGDWEPDEAERNAAWEMYVELVTRVSVVELGPAEGSLREALSSLYSLFGTTRDILRRYGPSVAQPTHDGALSFGAIAIAVLNAGLRPLLADWHTQLLAYEATRPPGVSPVDHERAWEYHDKLRHALQELRIPMRAYADTLSHAARVPTLTAEIDAAYPRM
jgi:hypothetical protein